MTLTTPIPHPLFLGISVHYEWPAKFGIYFHDGFWSYDVYQKSFTDVPVCDAQTKECSEQHLHNEIVEYIRKYQQEKQCKIIMSGLINGEHHHSDDKLKQLGALLWKELDIVPCITTATGVSMDERACSVARKTTAWLAPGHFAGLIRVQVGYRHEVEVDGNGRLFLSELDDYKRFCTPDLWKELLTTAEQVVQKNKKIVFFNSTPQGGGVAIIRHSTIRLFRLLGIEAHWFVMKPNPEVFEITKKKFHNILQGVAPEGTELTEKDQNTWKQWCENNCTSYWTKQDDVDLNPVAHADIIVIDDPQPCGMITLLKKYAPYAKFIYRSHIELRSDLIDTERTPQEKVFRFLWNDHISLCDTFVSHPVDSFIPQIVKDSGMRIVKMPAITDPIDGLNKELDEYSLDYYHLLFNRINYDQNEKKLEFSRPYFVQIARFDPSKGIPDLIDAYILFRNSLHDVERKDIPQLVITGHGSIDDPEGAVIFEQVTEKLKRLREEHLQEILDDIHVVRLGPSDQMLNAVLSSATCAFQLSLREGFEIKVTEALLKGVPVIAYRTGGIPLQIVSEGDEQDGYLLTVHDGEGVAEIMKKLTLDKAHRDWLSDNAKKRKRDWVLTPSNVLIWSKMLLEFEGSSSETMKKGKGQKKQQNLPKYIHVPIPKLTHTKTIKQLDMNVVVRLNDSGQPVVKVESTTARYK
jgi:alpha,alpha-trehalose phosphorylase (configuration-retaining)